MDNIASKLSNEANAFLTATSERTDLNQYWFSNRTISAFVDEIVGCGGAAALVSSPSVYFSLPQDARERCKVLDFDKQWSTDSGYVFYDFNDPEGVPSELRGAFDFVLVDPPFITREVWEKYATTTKLLLKAGGRVLCTTIAENEAMMKELLELSPMHFRPSIPTLVYQYSVYTNYTSASLDQLNPEIDDDDWMVMRAQDVLRESSKLNVMAEPEPIIVVSNQHYFDTIADDKKFTAKDTQSVEVDVSPPPGVECLTQFRALLNTLKKSTEGINAPIQMAIRRREAGGEAAGQAAKKADLALDAAATAVAALESWFSQNYCEVAEALGEVPESFSLCVAEDRWRTKAVTETIAKARGGFESMAAYNNFALASKQHTAAIFRSSNLVLDRIKALKKNC